MRPLRRSMLVHGFMLLVRFPGALFWTYALNLGIALLFSLHVHAELSDVLNHSLAAERLTSAFDLGTLGALSERLNRHVPSNGIGGFAGLPLYLLAYFILVPGALFCFRAEVPARPSVLANIGLSYFWRFVRVTLLALLAAAIVLVPLALLHQAFDSSIGDALTGWPSIAAEFLWLLLFTLVAALLRLYFDLVEVYVLLLGEHYLASGRQNRRVRTALKPAFHTLRLNLPRAYGSFLLLALLGALAMFFTARTATHMLAQPRVWPAFLLLQIGILAMIATRYWQRSAETILGCDFPLATPEPLWPSMPGEPVIPPPLGPATCYPSHFASDAQSDPEPAPPSLPEPDPQVFHHPPTTPAPPTDPSL